MPGAGAGGSIPAHNLAEKPTRSQSIRHCALSRVRATADGADSHRQIPWSKSALGGRHRRFSELWFKNQESRIENRESRIENREACVYLFISGFSI
jgi:hypothetical protein